MPALPAARARPARHRAARRPLPAHGPRFATTSQENDGRPGPAAAGPRRPPIPGRRIRDQGDRSRAARVDQQLDRGVSIVIAPASTSRDQQYPIGRLPELPSQEDRAGCRHRSPPPPAAATATPFVSSSNSRHAPPSRASGPIPAHHTGSTRQPGPGEGPGPGGGGPAGAALGQRVLRLQAALQSHVAARRIAEPAALCFLARATARFTAMVVVPTPPLPPKTTIRCGRAAAGHARPNLADEGSKFGGLIVHVLLSGRIVF